MQLPDSIQFVKPCIVQIGHAPPALPGTAMGTGFFVADAYVITAHHVVEALGLGVGDQLGVGLAGPDVEEDEYEVRASFVNLPSSVKAVDPAKDLALIEVDDLAIGRFPSMKVDIDGKTFSGALPRPIPLLERRVREGEEIALSGYPLSAPSLVTTSGVIASTFVPDANDKDDVRFLGDITANGGNSGGPVYSVRDGRLVGVCVAGKLAPVVGASSDGLHANAGLTVIVPVKCVRAFAEANGVTPGTSTVWGVAANRPRAAQQGSKKKWK